jgi:monoamine oxidase
MAPHAKFVALYDRAFWREAGLSGTAQSMVGPLAEVHDATTASGQAALSGFVGIPAAERQAMGQDAIGDAAIRQLVTLFGPAAGAPRATLYKDWAADELTATDLDWTDGSHPIADTRDWVDEAWRGWLTLAGSETSPSEPGYLAGAMHAAGCAASEVTQLLASRR